MGVRIPPWSPVFRKYMMMRYDVGTKFFKVEKHYTSRIMREYRVDENGDRWYREKEQSYKTVIQEYEIVGRRDYHYVGDASVFRDEETVMYAICNPFKNEDVVFVVPEYFENDVFFTRKDAEDYVGLLDSLRKSKKQGNKQ